MWINIVNNLNNLSKNNHYDWLDIVPSNFFPTFSYQNGIILNVQFETPLTSLLHHVPDYWQILFSFWHVSRDLLDICGQWCFLYHAEEVPFNSKFIKSLFWEMDIEFYWKLFWGNDWANRLNEKNLEYTLLGILLIQLLLDFFKRLCIIFIRWIYRFLFCMYFWHAFRVTLLYNVSQDAFCLAHCSGNTDIHGKELYMPGPRPHTLQTSPP